jgi:hypothetical protein
MLEELLPSPVLCVGLAGHRNIALSGVAAEAIEHGIEALLEALQDALTPAIAREAAFFSPAPAVMRLITTGAEGADLLGMRAANKRAVKISCVIPFAREEYRSDFSPAAAAVAADLLSRTEALLELPGQRSEGPRAFERANDIVLSNIDVLVAVWDGGRAHGRAGTGDVVQAAVDNGIPVLVINPAAPGTASLLAAPHGEDIEPPVASDLGRKPLPADLTEFVHTLVSPPLKRVQQQGLKDLVAETPRSADWRFEYPLLLKTLARRPKIRRTFAAATAAAENTAPPVDEAALSVASANSKRLENVEHARQIIDGLAVQYGRRFRSSSVSQYLIVILGTWLSGLIGLLIPKLATASIGVQLLASALVLADAAFRARRRWQERWLDYRVVAERLRWLGFRYSFGLGPGRRIQSAAPRRKSWADWYLVRTAHALGPPEGKIDAVSIGAAADHLTKVEIPQQIDYHRVTFRQLGLLERRLSLAAHGSLLAAVVVAVLFAIAALHAGGLNAVGWKRAAILLLTLLPITMTTLNGLRVDADLARLVERSAQTTALLFRARRVMLAAPRDYDHVASNMQWLAAILRGELEEWRFVIESRRSRGGVRPIKQKQGLRRRLDALRKRLS